MEKKKKNEGGIEKEDDCLLYYARLYIYTYIPNMVYLLRLFFGQITNGIESYLQYHDRIGDDSNDIPDEENEGDEPVRG